MDAEVFFLEARERFLEAPDVFAEPAFFEEADFFPEPAFLEEADCAPLAVLFLPAPFLAGVFFFETVKGCLAAFEAFFCKVEAFFFPPGPFFLEAPDAFFAERWAFFFFAASSFFNLGQYSLATM